MNIRRVLVTPDEVGIEIRGGGNATRQINSMMPPNFPAHRLIVVEVFTPAGNWSSFPPHKHDVHNPPGEVDLEEIYYYRIDKPKVSRCRRCTRPTAASTKRSLCAMANWCSFRRVIIQW